VASENRIPYRPLGILKTVVEHLGFQVTHCYEDLVFIEHNAFLLRMEEQGEEVSLFFNSESDVDKRVEIADLFRAEGKLHQLVISSPGTYQMIPNEADGTIHLEFLE
jgi:hypothetical protein